MDYGQDVAVLGEVDGLTGGQPVSDGQHLLKFEIQLYKVRDNEYVVDFQVRAVDTTTYLPCCTILRCCGIDSTVLVKGTPTHLAPLRCARAALASWRSSLQVSKADDAVLLMQRLQGELFLFLDMCSGLL